MNLDLDFFLSSSQYCHSIMNHYCQPFSSSLSHFPYVMTSAQICSSLSWSQALDTKLEPMNPLQINKAIIKFEFSKSFNQKGSITEHSLSYAKTSQNNANTFSAIQNLFSNLEPLALQIIFHFSCQNYSIKVLCFKLFIMSLLRVIFFQLN